ncbi:MAG TPA: glycogen/starch/alpha-glucan phosphorylase [Syntrophorhabdaceae bacterium]|nr:glycogen/starch/alpha-glucan phosphorylase [Syntrophorhabdaceae bacterium]HPU29709.1 glycogen/starch/alpha-glucan phosphorylase [Syntrophorhabdaceae bacterium]
MIENLEALYKSLMDNLIHELAKDLYSATSRDKFESVVLSVRKNLAKKWIETQQMYYNVGAKRVYYLSLEFLLGRLLRNYIINLNMSDEYSQAVDILGISFEEVLEHEWDAGLGNGGLGRLAACFLDSLSTLQYPGYGYGIRYEFGIFTQKIKDGYQVEAPDNWLRYGNPWEFPRPELLYNIKFYGKVKTIQGQNGKFRMEWVDTEDVMAMAYDYPVPGYKNNTVNTLRLWAAKATRDFNLEYFNSGDYIKAVEDKFSSEYISKVLYPNDQSMAGKELRLKQQYFFVSATLKDILRRYKKTYRTFKKLPEKVAIQLNDTHPSIAIAELMRILVDEENLPWDTAWDITNRVFAYTNHTILPEALEIWPAGLFAWLLPRHLQIIQEIDRRFMIQVKERFPENHDIHNKMGIITGDKDGTIHMARLAIVGSHKINGVSKLHTEILKKKVFKEFYEMMPEKFINITNGITQRRWLLQSNPQLSQLITEAIGDKWITELTELRKLEQFVDDSEFCIQFRKIKESNKEELSRYLTNMYQLHFEKDFLLDCQIKRFHEYKRQILNVLHIITVYNRIREGRLGDYFVPRTFLFSGKAAPAYYLCKLIIKLIHNVKMIIDGNDWLKNKIQVVFAPNYSVTLAQKIIPAAELSEQISTAGYEASGTGNMKFALNGAITIGTLDGANIEIKDEVGEENFFAFGLTAEEIMNLRQSYNPFMYYEKNEELKKAIDQIRDGYFSPEQLNLFQPIVNALLQRDEYFVLADYESYIECQERVGRTYLDADRWTKMAILNVARSGIFSSDRSIKEYAEKVWGIKPVLV